MAVMTQEQITLSSVTDIMTTCRYYLLQDSALAAPTKPTIYPPASPWVKTEPTYTAGSKNSLYFVDCTLFSDETFAYTDVSMSSSYEASKVAYEKAVEASNAANNAVNVAGNANTSAQNAATQAAAAQQAAQQAQTDAEAAQKNAATAQGTADDAKKKAEAAQETISNVQAELKTANEEIDGLAESLETLSNTMSADYAKKGELTDVQASLETQISQNATEISATAKKVSEVEVTANGAAEQVIQAKQAAQAAQNTADLAKTNAANAASAAQVAQKAADDAQDDADAAAQAASDAQAGVNSANADLALAKANLAALESRTDATEEEIAEAQAAVSAAQTAADAANAAAATAQSTANTAKTNAATAQTAANNAKTAADNAQKAADDAQDTADAVAAEAEALKSRMTTAETNISQNAEAIALRATKTEVAKTLEGYYTKTQTDAKIKVEADKITSQASEISSLGTRMSTVEQTASGLTVSLNTTNENVTKAQNAADAAAQVAQEAQDTADDAQADATAAKNTANSASSTANTAASNASTAVSTANTAKDNAATALSKANTATSDAATAVSTANTAKTNAATAQSTANAAKSSAEDAQNAVEKSYQKGVSRGEQLITNGNGLLGDNTNFSAWAFDGAVSNNSPGSFTMAQGTKKTVVTDEFFPVSTNNEYTFALDVKSKYGLSRLYSMLLFYDADKNEIVADHHMYNDASTTTLAQDLKKGDTVIYLTDASGWSTSYSYGYYLTIWDYVNSFGYKYPAETYTRHRITLPKTSDNKLNSSCLNKTANTITLTTAYSGATIPAGTAVSQGSDGANYKYTPLSNTLVGTEWKRYTGKLSSVDYSGKNAASKFPPGTAYAKVGFLWNNNGAADQVWVTNIVVTDSTSVSAAQTAANQAKTDAANAAKTATNYLNFSSLGLIIGDMTASTLGNNILIDTDSMDIRIGEAVLASFGANLIELGKNAADTIISMCGGNCTITAEENQIIHFEAPGGFGFYGTYYDVLCREARIHARNNAETSSMYMMLDASDDNNCIFITEMFANNKQAFALSVDATESRSSLGVFVDRISLSCRGVETIPMYTGLEITNFDIRLVGSDITTDGSIDAEGRIYTQSYISALGGFTSYDNIEIHGFDDPTQANTPHIYWSNSHNGKEPYIGYAKDQNDGTFLWSITGTNYASGLAIGGGSGNLLWKGVRVATVNDIPSTSNFLPLTGGNISGHVYLTGAKPSSSTGNTSQLVFGTASDNHLAITSNDNALVLNPSTTATSDSATGASQIVLYLTKASVFPKGIQANVTGNLTGTASKATADANGNNIASTYASKDVVTTMINNAIGGAMGAYY